MLSDQIIRCKKLIIVILIDVYRLLSPGIPLTGGLTLKIAAEIKFDRPKGNA